MRTCMWMAFVLGAAGVLAGCGGQEGVSLDAPALTVTARPIKALAFEWDAVAGATHYRLFEDVDGEAGPEPEQPLGDALPAGQQSLAKEVFLPARVNARYRLQACAGEACVDSAHVGIGGIDRGIGYFKASNAAAADEFGEGLALSADGNFLAVGAYLEDGLNVGVGSQPQRGAVDANVGAVYVFRRGDAGWLQEAYIKPAKALPGAQFGFRVALSGNGQRLLVGSPSDASGASGVGANPSAGPARAASGAAYVFDRDASGVWTQSVYIKAPASEAGAQFGQALSLSHDGQWAAVGQPFSAAGGSVSMYRHEAGGWGWQAQLTARYPGAGDNFGESLQLDPQGETLVVSASREDSAAGGADNALVDSGAVQVFQRDGNGVWQDLAYLKAPMPRLNGFFGYPVAVSAQGRTIVVGEPSYGTVGTTSKVGRVHVFRAQGATWALETSLTTPSPEASGTFGQTLALAADGATVAIANSGDDAPTLGLSGAPVLDAQVRNTGSVYVYRRDAAGTWSSPIHVQAPNSQFDLYFGWSLALSADGGTLAAYGSDYSSSSGIGGDQNDRSGQWTGAVYLY